MDGEQVQPVPGTLQAFLADRDVACPHCQYNVRGVVATVCPECGRDLELCLRESHPLALRRGLLALALLWLLAIGGVQTARCGREVYQTAGRMQWQTLSSIRGPINVQSTTILRYVSPGNVTITPPASGAASATGSNNSRTHTANISASPATGTAAGGPVTIQSSGGTTLLRQGGNIRVVTPGITFAPTLTWSNVSGVQWVRLGAWSAAAILGLIGTLLLLAYRRRSPSARAMRIMMAAAWAGFVIAAGIEVQTLISEVI